MHNVIHVKGSFHLVSPTKFPYELNITLDVDKNNILDQLDAFLEQDIPETEIRIEITVPNEQFLGFWEGIPVGFYYEI